MPGPIERVFQRSPPYSFCHLGSRGSILKAYLVFSSGSPDILLYFSTFKFSSFILSVYICFIFLKIGLSENENFAF